MRKSSNHDHGTRSWDPLRRDIFFSCGGQVFSPLTAASFVTTHEREFRAFHTLTLLEKTLTYTTFERALVWSNSPIRVRLRNLFLLLDNSGLFFGSCKNDRTFQMTDLAIFIKSRPFEFDQVLEWPTVKVTNYVVYYRCIKLSVIIVH